MARKKGKDVIVGLDIGTTKICTVVGEKAIGGGVDIIGLGSYPSKGLRKGVVVNIETTVLSIKKAVEEAELMAGCDIGSVYAGIAGGHIKGINSHGIIAIKNREITEADIKRVISAASAVAIPMDREVIHVIPQEFIVDDHGGIKDPIGMFGVRLEGKVHIVTGAVTSAQNIIRCANRAGLNVDDIVLEQLGSSEAVLTNEEKDIGLQRGILYPLAVLLIMFVCFFLMRYLGFIVPVLLFLLMLMEFLERGKRKLHVGITILTGFILYFVFAYWMGIPFPTGILGI